MSTAEKVVEHKHFHVTKALELEIICHEDIGLFEYSRRELNL